MDVEALATASRRLFVGGDFVTIEGQTRKHIAAFDLPNGSLANSNPGADLDVIALAASGPSVFAGGYFGELGKQPHEGLAKIDAVAGTVAPAAANVDGNVLALTVVQNTLYVDQATPTQLGRFLRSSVR